MKWGDYPYHGTTKSGGLFGQTLITGPNKQTHICNCVGPQNGQPLCPCAMRGVIVRDGRYIQPERDLGPATPADIKTAVQP